MSALTDGYFSLGKDTNKVDALPGDQGDTIVGDLLPELELSMSDDELINLKRDWIKNWEPYEKEILKKQTDNENYWLGQQFSVQDEKRPVVDNLIFESLETFLPIATSPHLDPVVDSSDDELAAKTQKMLSYLSEELAFNLTLKQVIRYWGLYMLGVLKVGWSMKENDITCAAIRPQKMILDPKASIVNCEYTGYYLGEYVEDQASDLVIRFPKKETYIKGKVKDKMGTTVRYILWTTDEYMFWTLDDEVLAKRKNPHWNYESSQEGQMDEYGKPGVPQKIPGKNHFKNKKKPYIFYSFFNLGKQPHDDTNLIQQNIPLQDLVNKRLVQMDKNADNANGGLAVSGDAFTEQQAAAAAKAKRKGGVIWVPTGPVTNAVVELNGAQLPNFVYESLVDYRGELRNIFGIRGSSPQGLSGERTVRGKMFMQQQDQARIGGGMAAVLEEFATSTLNWFVQLMYVYYDEQHEAIILGDDKAKEYIKLSQQDFTSKVTVGVKDGSMIPVDPESKRQEAMQLWSQKAIDPITFFSRLGFSNPKESAKNLFLWLSDPIQLFPELAQQAAQQQKPQDKPTVTINYKDVEDPTAKAQLLAEAGIQVQPQQIQQGQQMQQVDATRQKVHDHQLGMITAAQTHKHTIEKTLADGLVKSHLQVKQQKHGNPKQ